MNDLVIRELIRSKDEKRILTEKIARIEDEYYKAENEYIPCAIVWYEDIKVYFYCKQIIIFGTR